MKQAGLVTNIKRGWYELTQRGRDILADETTKLNSKYLEQFDEFQEFRSRTSGSDSTISDISEETNSNTPDESLQAAHKKLDDALAASLLDFLYV